MSPIKKRSIGKKKKKTLKKKIIGDNNPAKNWHLFLEKNKNEKMKNNCSRGEIYIQSTQLVKKGPETPPDTPDPEFFQRLVTLSPPGRLVTAWSPCHRLGALSPPGRFVTAWVPSHRQVTWSPPGHLVTAWVPCHRLVTLSPLGHLVAACSPGQRLVT